MQTTEYQVIDTTGFVVSAGDNRQDPIRVARQMHELMPCYPISFPLEVVRIVTEKETVGWVLQ